MRIRILILCVALGLLLNCGRGLSPPGGFPGFGIATIADQHLIIGTDTLDVTASFTGDTAPLYMFDNNNMTCDDIGWTGLQVNASTGEITGTPPAATTPQSCTVQIIAATVAGSYVRSFTVTLYPTFPGTFTCDTGDARTTCTINTVKNLNDGDVIATPGEIVVATGGQINSNALEDVTLYATGGITVQNGGTILANLVDSFAGSLTIDSGGNLSALALGNPGGVVGAAGSGTGGGTAGGSGNGGGGSYGGTGHTNAQNNGFGGATYGSFSQPTDYGSGGGGASCCSAAAGSGGGRIKITVSGTASVNGTLQVNGQTPAGQNAGGSGGSLWIIADRLTGSGTISAAGGDGSLRGGAGGGGRIALDTGTNSFGGTIDVSSGTNGRYVANSNGTLSTTFTSFCDSGTPETTCVINSTKWIGDNFNFSGTGNLIIASGGTVRQAGLQKSWNFSWTDVTVQNGGSIIGSIADGSARSLTIDAGGTIQANGLGFIGGTVLPSNGGSGVGPGGGGTSTGGGGGGGGHGGAGGNGSGAGAGAGGATNGSLTMPVLHGSSGASGSCCSSSERGGNGAGLFKLTVSDTITVDGTFSANGADGLGNGAGGAGGSVWLIANTIQGTGTLEANGGNGPSNGGGGGGGRISLDVTTDTLTGSGTVQVLGGTSGGGSSGSVGTIN